MCSSGSPWRCPPGAGVCDSLCSGTVTALSLLFSVCVGFNALTFRALCGRSGLWGLGGVGAAWSFRSLPGVPGGAAFSVAAMPSALSAHSLQIEPHFIEIRTVMLDAERVAPGRRGASMFQKMHESDLNTRVYFVFLKLFC